MLRKISFLAIVALTIVTMCVGQARASSIQGAVEFVGGVAVYFDGIQTNDLGLADYIVPDSLQISTAKGDFAALLGTLATCKGVWLNYAFTPVDSFWQVQIGSVAYSFDLTSLAITNWDSSNLALEGSGVLHITGFDDTAATWSFSALGRTNVRSSGGTFPFSGNTTAAVPVPATLILLSSGLPVVFAAMRRRRGNSL